MAPQTDKIMYSMPINHPSNRASVEKSAPWFWNSGVRAWGSLPLSCLTEDTVCLLLAAAAVAIASLACFLVRVQVLIGSLIVVAFNVLLTSSKLPYFASLSTQSNDLGISTMLYTYIYMNKLLSPKKNAELEHTVTHSSQL
jgi:hypothetical protein